MPLDIVGAAGEDDQLATIIDALSGLELGAVANQKIARVGNQVKASSLPIGFAGLTPVSIATTLSNTTTAPLNVNMRLDRIVMGQASCVALSRITGVQIGSINLLVGSSPIPCEVFRYDAVATSIKAAVVATPSVPPTFAFVNATAGTVVYEGCIMGPVVRD